MLIGCGKENNEDVYNDIVEKYDQLKSYQLEGKLEMINNETTYEYDVKSTYKETNNFKVELTNKINDHKQIILRNKEGVYVVTPSLNKSFKFQSEWPYNNSQVYLLQSIMQDIKNDKNRKIKIDDNKKIIESSVNYINNKKLVKQKVIFSKKNIMKSVEVYNDDGIVQIRINFEKIKLNPKIEDDVFNLDKNISLEVEEKELPTGKIEDIIYPMYLPEDTKLTNQQKFNIENGERVILTFSNEDNKTMTFIQETANNDENIVSVDGNLSHIGDVIGVINEEYLYWNTNGVDYYLISNSIENDQLLEVAKSINTVSVIK